GLGYYGRARNLQKAAQQIMTKGGGQFPARLEDALALPGIGNYTAAAILSIAYGKQLAVLDGNVARVLARLGAIHGDIREPQRWGQLQETANGLLDARSPGDWNKAMMELGATLCTPKSPQCLLCPVAQFCEGRKWRLVPAGKVRHTVTYRAITLLPFLIETRNLPFLQGAKQVPLNDISSLPVSNLTRKVARAALAAAVRAAVER